MYNTDIKRGYLSTGFDSKDSSLEFQRVGNIPKIFVVCDQRNTAPVWGYILRQEGLTVILETSRDKAIDHSSTEMPDLVVLDIDVAHGERMELYRKFRAVSVAPILILLPTYHETQILEA